MSVSPKRQRHSSLFKLQLWEKTSLFLFCAVKQASNFPQNPNQLQQTSKEADNILGIRVNSKRNHDLQHYTL